MLECVRQVYESGVVHRNLKLENLVVSMDGVRLLFVPLPPLMPAPFISLSFLSSAAISLIDSVLMRSMLEYVREAHESGVAHGDS